MGKLRQVGWVALAAGLLLVGLEGCSGVPGRSLFTPPTHRLIPAAKEMRDAATEPAPLPRELDKRVLPPYLVEPGDVLLLYPADLDSPIRLPGDQPVNMDGTINLGRYGFLPVAGKTLPDIEAAARALIEAQSEGKPVGPIVVRLIAHPTKVYYVLGEVNAPGSYQLQGFETVLQGICTAGNLTDKASRRRIILSRPTPHGDCRIVLPICYNDIVQLGDTATNYQLAPGDRIYVPTRTFWEDLFHCEPECPPCGGPQVPCAARGGSCAPAAAGFSTLPAAPAQAQPAQPVPAPAAGEKPTLLPLRLSKLPDN